MNWEDKWAVLKLAGYWLGVNPKWDEHPTVIFKYLCELEEDDEWGDEWNYGSGESKEEAVCEAFWNYQKKLEYLGKQNEKVS